MSAYVKKVVKANTKYSIESKYSSHVIFQGEFQAAWQLCKQQSHSDQTAVWGQCQNKQVSFLPQKVLSSYHECNVKVTETGWGEFEIQIKIYLADPVERPVTIYHVLKLFQVSKKVNTPFCFATDKQIAFFLHRQGPDPPLTQARWRGASRSSQSSTMRSSSKIQHNTFR